MKRMLVLAMLLCCQELQASRLLEVTVAGRITAVGSDYVEVEGQRFGVERNGPLAHQLQQLGRGSRVSLQVSRSGTSATVKSIDSK